MEKEHPVARKTHSLKKDPRPTEQPSQKADGPFIEDTPSWSKPDKQTETTAPAADRENALPPIPVPKETPAKSGAKEKPGFLSRLFKSKGFRVLLILAIVAGLGWMLLIRPAVMSAREAMAPTYVPTLVSLGDLKVSIDGSGVVAPKQRYDVVSTVKGEVLTDTIEIGQKVEKDETLYTVDNTDAQSSIKHAELSLERAKINLDQTTNSDIDTRILSDMAGTITVLYVKNGDTVMKGGKVADVVDTATLKLKVPFNKADIGHINAGDNASVYLESTGEVIQGRVRKVLTGERASASGAVVRDVEISFVNPGAVNPGHLATAQVGPYACNDIGTIDYGDKATVSAKANGEIRGLSLSEGDQVKRGVSFARVQLDDNKNSERNSAIGVEESELALEDSKKQLDNYSITSPIAGTVVDKLIKAGDTLEAGKTTLAIVADMTSLVFTMNIDELDINNVDVGQKVVVTADALTDQSYTGYIDNIGILGNSQNGVTTYPVKVVVEKYGDLRPGMNVNASIVARSVTGVMCVPVDAVVRGHLVLVSEATAKDLPVADTGDNTPGKIVAMNDTPKGYKYVRVETGINDGYHVEITSGLEPGMEVYSVVAGSVTFFGMPSGGMQNPGGMRGEARTVVVEG